MPEFAPPAFGAEFELAAWQDFTYEATQAIANAGFHNRVPTYVSSNSNPHSLLPNGWGITEDIHNGIELATPTTPSIFTLTALTASLDSFGKFCDQAVAEHTPAGDHFVKSAFTLGEDLSHRSLGNHLNFGFVAPHDKTLPEYVFPYLLACRIISGQGYYSLNTESNVTFGLWAKLETTTILKKTAGMGQALSDQRTDMAGRYHDVSVDAPHSRVSILAAASLGIILRLREVQAELKLNEDPLLPKIRMDLSDKDDEILDRIKEIYKPTTLDAELSLSYLKDMKLTVYLNNEYKTLPLLDILVIYSEHILKQKKKLQELFDPKTVKEVIFTFNVLLKEAERIKDSESFLDLLWDDKGNCLDWVQKGIHLPTMIDEGWTPEEIILSQQTSGQLSSDRDEWMLPRLTPYEELNFDIPDFNQLEEGSRAEAMVKMAHLAQDYSLELTWTWDSLILKRPGTSKMLKINFPDPIGNFSSQWKDFYEFTEKQL